MEMKEVLNKMLNHEELSRTETRNIIVGITKDGFPTADNSVAYWFADAWCYC